MIFSATPSAPRWAGVTFEPCLRSLTVRVRTQTGRTGGRNPILVPSLIVIFVLIFIPIFVDKDRDKDRDKAARPPIFRRIPSSTLTATWDHGMAVT